MELLLVERGVETVMLDPAILHTDVDRKVVVEVKTRYWKIGAS